MRNNEFCERKERKEAYERMLKEVKGFWKKKKRQRVYLIVE